MKLIRNSVLLTCCLWASGLGLAQQNIAKPVLTPAPSAVVDAPAPPVPVPEPLTVSPNYVIGADDVLKIDVWKEPQLSGQQPVRPDGKISMDLIHEVPAAGFTPMQLAADIAARLTKFVHDPVVDVSVQAVNSKRIFFVGEVGHTGPMQIMPGMTVLQAISTAGLTPYANKKKIYILRGDPAHQQKVMFDYKRALQKGDMQGVSLVPGDTIVVP